MPMFDDPQKELRRLQRELLAAEEEEQRDEEQVDEDAALEELLAEYGEEDYREFFESDYEEESQEPMYRNFSNGYGADIRNFANGYRGQALVVDDEEEDEYDDFDDGYRDEDAALYTSEVKAARRRRGKGTGRLMLLLFLEILGILGILLWWVVQLW